MLQVKALQPTDLTRMLWGFARMGHYPGARLLVSAASQLCLELPTCPPALLRRLLWSFKRFQTMGYHDDSILVAIIEELPRAAHLRDDASECAW